MPYKCSVCSKSFRYKISQKTHKCNGILVRQRGDLLQKLLDSSSILPTPVEANVAALDIVESKTSEEMCLDAFVKESYDKLLNSQELHSSSLISLEKELNDQNNSNLLLSPSSRSFQQNQNICVSFPSNLETINEDSIKELLYGQGNDVIL